MFARIQYDLFTVASVVGAHNHSLQLPRKKITSVTTSSLEVIPGSLFVPLIDRRDGHDFIADALKRGAAAFFARAGHPVLKGLSPADREKAIEVADPLAALGALAAFHRNRFSPVVIAVTGSNGKTTTKEMLAQIFRSELGRQCIATEKNYNNHIGVPFTLFAIGEETRVAIVEMGMNHAGEIDYLSRMARPHAAVISSIGHAHIEFFKSRAGIAAAKAEIVAGMAKGGSLYVPATIAELSTITAAAPRNKVIIKKIVLGPGKKSAQPFRILSSGPRGFDLSLADKTVRFPYANAAWLSNLALAAAVAADYGLSPESVRRAIQKFRPAAGRMQLKRGRFTVIDDGYNANPDSAVASIDSALLLAAGKPVICVFGDFKELGKWSKKLHAWTGSEAAKKGVAAFYAVGSDMRHAANAFRKVRGKSGRSYAYGREAVTELCRQLLLEPKGSVILVKGSRSMKMEEIVTALIASA